MRSVAILLAVGLLAGCQQNPQLNSAPTTQGAQPAAMTTAPPIETVPVESPTTRPTVAGSVVVLGDIKNPGQRDLCSGQKVSDVLKCCELSTRATKMTLVLNRRCPEGTTRELIDLDQNLTLVDATRDYVLRDGDELVVSVAPSIPTGLSRPMTAEMPH